MELNIMVYFLHVDSVKTVRRVGGYISTESLYRQMRLLGHRVEVLHCDVENMKKEIEIRSPDIILSTSSGSIEACSIANSLDIPSSIYVRNESRSLELLWTLKRTKIVCNSQYLKNELKKLNVSSIVIPSIIDEDFDIVHSGTQYLTMINPVPEKGVGLFFELADSMPGEQFLLVEGTWPCDYSMARDQARSMQNVFWMPAVNDPREIYKHTEILLIPSVWGESSPRVALEAAASGTPCVASNKGGIPDMVSDFGVVVSEPTVGMYASAIKQVRDKYKTFSVFARLVARQKRMHSRSIAQRFVEVVC
jgi:glycosyltransferase involved in cell wall biosynthesis